jgi:PAS domain S-box-containing protein
MGNHMASRTRALNRVIIFGFLISIAFGVFGAYLDSGLSSDLANSAGIMAISLVVHFVLYAINSSTRIRIITIAATFLIFFGLTLDITENFEALSEWPVFGNSSQWNGTLNSLSYLLGVVVIFVATLLAATEAAKREEERKQLNLVADNVSDVIWTTDLDLKTTYASASMTRFTGYSAEETLALTAEDLLTAESVARASSTLQQAYDQIADGTRSPEDSTTNELEFRRKDESTVWAEMSTRFIQDQSGAIVGVLSVSRDITERRIVEQALRESEEDLRTTLDSIGDAVIATDTLGRVTRMNPVAEALTGWPFAEANGRELTEVFSVRNSQTHETVPNPVSMVIRSGEVVGLSNHSLLHSREGIDYQIADSAAPILNTNEEITGVVMVFRDVTDTYTMNAAVQESERKFRSYFELGLMGMAITSLEKGWVEFNDTLCEMFGYSRSEFRQMTWEELTHPDDLGADVASFNKVLSGETDGYSMEKRFFHRDGTIVNAIISANAVRKDDGSVDYFVALVHDISDRIRAEEERENLISQLNHVQKMESVGRLAGGVAHDFNNMLEVIIGHSELAMQSTQSNPELAEHLDEIRKAAEHSANLTRQLLAFARKQTITPKIIDLNKSVEATTKMLKRLIGEDIQLSIHPGEDLWSVKIDPSQFDQILTNLSVNARDAIDGVGQITITSENVKVDGLKIGADSEITPGEYVQLTVRDNGRGMSPEIRGQLFEPFFTTKPQGEGTGLGLATLYGIVRQNDGFIDVVSELGQGSSFIIYMPRAYGERVTVPSSPTDSESTGGNETILIVEDEKSILYLVRKLLEREGYTVFTATTPEEARNIAEIHGSKIQLLLTDVVMPEMNGLDLSAELIEYMPHLKSLYMSGYTADIIADHGILDPNVTFIQKPFSMKDLATRVREALNQPGTVR